MESAEMETENGKTAKRSKRQNGKTVKRETAQTENGKNGTRPHGQF